MITQSPRKIQTASRPGKQQVPAESSLTAVCPGCGKYGTAGGFEAAVAHTANARRCLHVVFELLRSQ